jgi:glycosyltransferase involved in cell wall biosynthesis
MRISIAMCTYNGAKYIVEQIESIAKQSVLPLELVVCDDGSTDDTINILKNISSQLPFNVRIYQNEENLHFTGNFLKAASLCIGDAIAFCDQDDIWDSRKIEICAAALIADQADIVIHEGRVVDSAGQPTTAKIPDFSGDLKDINKAPFDRVSKGFAMVIRREVIEGVMTSWDWNDYSVFKREYGPPLGHDLFIYAWCLGKKISCIREELVRYRVHGENVTASVDITKNRVSRFMAFLRGLALKEENYSLPGHKWAAEVEFLKAYMSRCGTARHPGLVQLSVWLERKSTLWLDRATIYDNKSTRPKRWRQIMHLLYSGGYISNQVPRLGFKALGKDAIVATIY